MKSLSDRRGEQNGRFLSRPHNDPIAVDEIEPIVI
jgi:hypothetical protein